MASKSGNGFCRETRRVISKPSKFRVKKLRIECPLSANDIQTSGGAHKMYTISQLPRHGTATTSMHTSTKSYSWPPRGTSCHYALDYQAVSVYPALYELIASASRDASARNSSGSLPIRATRTQQLCCGSQERDRAWQHRLWNKSGNLVQFRGCASPPAVSLVSAEAGRRRLCARWHYSDGCRWLQGDETETFVAGGRCFHSMKEEIRVFASVVLLNALQYFVHGYSADRCRAACPFLITVTSGAVELDAAFKMWNAPSAARILLLNNHLSDVSYRDRGFHTFCRGRHQRLAFLLSCLTTPQTRLSSHATNKAPL